LMKHHKITKAKVQEINAFATTMVVRGIIG
jgi:hypothetical protein